MLSEVETITDDVVIIHHGEIVAQDTLGKIMDKLPSLEELFFSLTDGGDET